MGITTQSSLTARGWLAGLLERWARRRQGEDKLPRNLHRNRLYILPTKVGMVFAAMLFVMLLGSMNYSNSMGLALTFALSGLGLISMHQCHRNMLDLVVHGVSAVPVFAGHDAQFCVRLLNPSPRKRYQVQLRLADSARPIHDISASGSEDFLISLPTNKRGVLRLDRLSVTSAHPFSFFRCWTWLHMPMYCLVYPRPAPAGIPPPHTDVDVGGALHNGAGSEDFAGLRPYRYGDSPRHIAWKHFARDNTLLVKQFTGTSLSTRWLDLEHAPGNDLELKLSHLCRWVLSSNALGHSYGLRLPGTLIEPGSGNAQQARCLEALARFGDTPREDDLGTR
ncbi:MAG: DUF58 domain-containing protein [Gammaproteobacteria bacterium]|nr:DUF58 domain-containing protein [Gammaproteobacteria bacterium]